MYLNEFSIKFVEIWMHIVCFSATASNSIKWIDLQPYRNEKNIEIK